MLALLAPARAAAADGEPVVVLLLPRTQEAWQQPVVAAFRGQLADLPVTLRVEPLPLLRARLAEQARDARAVLERVGARAVFWLDDSHGDELLVAMLEPSGGRTVVRHVRDLADPDARAEAAALIARAQIEELLEPLASGSDAPTGGGPSLIRFEAGYASEWLDGVRPTAAAQLRLAGHVWRSLSVGLAVRPSFGAKRSGELGTLHLRRLPFALDVAWEFRFGPRWRLEPTLGVTLESLSSAGAYYVAGEGVEPEPDGPAFGLTAGLKLAYALSPSARVQFGAAADAIVAGPTSLALESRGRRETVYDPFLVRPRVTLGFAFDIP